MAKYEIEQKFRIKRPATIRKKLKQFKAKLIRKGEEYNEIYQIPRGLKGAEGVLRLRRHGKQYSLLTYKGPRLNFRYKKRLEIETPVSYEAAQKLLKQLGFKKVRTYRKFRESYRVGLSQVELDRVARLGWFLEIESSPAKIESLARRLELGPGDLEHRTYLQLIRT